MGRIRTIAVMAVLSLAVAGCTAFGAGNSGTDMMALASTSTPASPAGGIIGKVIGAELDSADRRAALDAEFRALEYGRTGVPVQWRGRNGRTWGDVWAGARYQINDFACRDYTHTIVIGGETQTARGTACRQPNGTWEAVG